MKKIHIYTDSASDMTWQELEDLDVELIPLTINVNQESIVDDKKTDSKVLWDYMEQGYVLTTSQPSPEAFMKTFDSAKENDEEGIYIGISSGVSGTFQGSRLALDIMDYDKIRCIDSQTGSAGLKLMVYKAVQLRKEGKTVDEIVHVLMDMISRIRIYIVLDTMEYLGRSGRIPKSVANIGNAVKVKPMVTVKDGKVEMVKLIRSKKKAMNELREIYRNANIDTSHKVIPLYSKDVSNCLEMIEPLELNPRSPQELGMIIGTHVGPNIYGLVYVEK